MKDGQIQSERIHNFDFLRGVFVYLALCQHFAAYLNGWYVWHFDDLGSSPLTLFHEQFANTRIDTDPIGVFLLWIFSPWVSHIYLALAAFNLAKRSKEEFRSVYKSKLLIFFSLFIFFFVENAIVSNSIGTMFSFYPLMAWMVILFTITLCYRFGGVQAVVALYIIGLLQTVLGFDHFFDQLEFYLIGNFHNAFEYDARLHYFLGSGGLGFLMGYLHFQKHAFSELRNVLLMLTAGLGFFLIWFLFGESFKIEPSEVMRFEHMFDQSFTGNCFNQGIQILVLTIFLYAHTIGRSIPTNLFHWIGVHSLLVFGFHRIFFLYLIAPTRELIGAVFGFPMTSHCIEVFIACFISVGLSYLLLRSPIPDIIFRQGLKAIEGQAKGEGKEKAKD